ncbi:MAG: oligoribonuclease [Actinomycetota bacterium]|jgi:oligoribonuclease
MDLEMTGLEPDKHVIVEIATLITDDQLQIIAEGPDLVIHANEAELAHMGEFVTAMHTKSGLLPEIVASTLTLSEAQSQTLAFIKEHVTEARTIPLCGNSIGTDRRFLQEYMPELEAYLHYRNVDVSTIKELAKRWFPEVLAQAEDKETTHRALDDIKASIAELAFYRQHLFTSAPAK